MDYCDDVEDAKLQDLVSKQSIINDPNEMEIPSEANGGTSSPDHRKEDGKKRCFCQDVAYSDMVACDNLECPYEWFHFECVGLEEPSVIGSWFCQDCTERGHASNYIASRCWLRSSGAVRNSDGKG